MPPSSPIEAFALKHARLIELERIAEIEESARLQASLSPAELEARGVTLLRLKVADERSGLGGRTLLVLEPTREGDLPAHRFQPGDIVAIRPAKGSTAGAATATAVVYRVLPRRITVALDVDPDEPFDEPLRLDRVANDVTYRRLKEGLERLRTYTRGPAARLRETLFGLRDPQGDAPRPLAALDASLDASQREAVAFALAAKEIALIHGPPGTGKTTAAVEAIRQAVARGDRVLACAASNIAVDNVAERLAAAGVRIVRVGHPARLLPSVVERSLDALVEAAEGTRIALDVRRELEQMRRNSAVRRRARSGTPSGMSCAACAPRCASSRIVPCATCSARRR